MRRPALIPLALIVGVLAISTAAVLIKLCDDAAPVVIAAARLSIATLVLLPVAAGVRGAAVLPHSRGQVAYLGLAGLFLAAHFFFWITSLKHTSVLSSVVIVTTNPIFIGVASYVLFKEKPSGRLVAAIVVASAGGGLIALSDTAAGSGSLYGDGMALAGAVMASGYFLIGRKVRRELHVLSYVTPVYAVAAAVLAGAALLTQHGFTDYRGSTYVYFVLLAVVPQLLGHGSLNWSLRYVSATTVAVCILGEPVGSTVLAFFILQERIAGLQALGGVLILAGVLLALRDPSVRDPAAR